MVKINVLLGIESAGGGAFKHVVYLATHLPKDKFNIILVYSNNRNESIEREIDTLKTHDLNIIEYPMERKLSPKKDIKAIRFLMQLISKFDIQIVHAHSSKAGFIFRLAGYFKRVNSIFYTPHCFHFQSKKGLVKCLSLNFERIMSLITSKIIVSDNEYQEGLRTGISKKSKYAVINNAISFDEIKLDYKIRKIKNEFNIPSEAKFIIGGIGRLELQKDWVTFVKVAKKVIIEIPDCIFLIVGEGSLKDDLKALIKENNLKEKVLLMGYVKDIYKVYNIIDLLLSTSLWEGLPYVTLEAESYGKPIIATSAISQQTSFFNNSCDAKDHKCVAKQVLQIIKSDKKDLKSYKKKENLKKYSFENFISSHIELYEIN